MKDEQDPICPASKAEWRQWLQQYHTTETSVWVKFYKKHAEGPTVTWSDAVDEALCFGWIDSKRVSIDQDCFRQFFSRRKPKSIWSKVNKDKVVQLIEAGLMTEAGLASIELAKKNGSWNMYDEVEGLIVPDDLEEAFNKIPGSRERFEALSRSAKKLHLFNLMMAKRPETRQKRIADIMSACAAK